MMARDIKEKSGVSVSLGIVQRVLQFSVNLVFRLLKVGPRLESWQIKQRFTWAKEYANYESFKWKGVIFLDEKRFCLGGPDGHAHFWGDNRLLRAIFLKRVRGDCGIMVRGAIAWKGKTNLVVVKGTLNANKYVEMLEEHLLIFIEEHHADTCIF